MSRHQRRRPPSRRDVERAREYLEGRGTNTDGWTDEEVLAAVKAGDWPVIAPRPEREKPG